MPRGSRRRAGPRSLDRGENAAAVAEVPEHLAHLPSLTTTELEGRLAETLDLAASEKERIVVVREGRPVAAVVPIEDVEWLEDAEERMAIVEARAGREEVEREGTVPLERLKAELGL